MAGLFGDTDAADIPDNPFYVAPDTYKCILVEAGTATSKNGDKHGVTFKWKIDDEDSDYYENSLSDWNTYYPDATTLTPNMKKDLARLKSRLLSMGVTEDQMNDPDFLESLDELVGLEAFVTVTESKDKHDPTKVYSNIQKIQLDE